MPSPVLSPTSFPTFGDLLRYLRRRERLTQLELSIAVGYSEAQISRLEQNQRLPDLAALQALFVPALHLEDQPDVTARLLDLARSARQEDSPIPGVAPYKGLLYFEEADSELFFGREALTTYLLERLDRIQVEAATRLLAIVGASGSGKSSLLRSGLAVSLKKAGWDVELFMPGAEPLKALNVHLDQASEGQKGRVILIDQFEETFTLCREEPRRAAFIQRLVALAKEPSGRTTIVIALRADFYSYLAQYPKLRTAVAAEQEYIGQMTAADLRRAIEEPARRGGWELEPGLVDVILHDVGADGAGLPEPGALPLLSHALLATWERRRGRTLTLDGYHAAGGVQSAIAVTAESIFTDHLNREQRELARSIFLRLTELGEGTEDTRRRASLNELAWRAEEAHKLRTVLDVLAAARLITLNADSAEVAHEALIREWQRLRDWLTEDRDGLRLHRHLTESSQDWEARGRDAAELYRGARLAQAREWAEQHPEQLNELEQRFLQTSIQQEHHEALEREAQRQREMEAARMLAESEARSANRLRMRNRILSIAGAVTLVLAVVAIVLAFQAHQNTVRAQSAEAQAVDQRNVADQQRSVAVNAQATAQAEQGQTAQEKSVAVSRELAAASLSNLTVDSDRSVLLALYALSQSQTKEAQEALHASVLNMRTKATFAGYTDVLSSLAFSPDGKRIALSSYDNSVGIWNIATGKEEVSIPASVDWDSMVTFSPDGKRLAVAGADSTVKIWDAFTGQNLWSVAHGGSVSSVSFSSDGTRIASSSEDKTARVWDAATGKSLLVLSGHTDTVWIVQFNRDSTHLVTASRDSTVRTWDAVTGRQLLLIPGVDNASTVAYSPDGSKLVIGYANGTVKVCDAVTGQVLLSWSAHTGIVMRVAFSPDGTQIGTSGSDHLVHLWDTATGQALLTLGVWGNSGLAFSPDGKELLTGMQDKSARIWDISSTSSHELLTVDTRSASILRNVGYSPDGKRFVTCSFDGNVQVWDAATGTELLRLAGHQGSVYRCIYSHDGRRIATTGSDGTERVWNVETGKELLRVTGHRGSYGIGNMFPGVMGIAFSPDGKLLATGGADDVANIWDIATGKQLALLPADPKTGLTGVDFSPDGKLLVTTTDDNGELRIWDTATGKLLHTVTTETRRTWDSAFSPDGRRLATTNGDGITKIWDVATWKLLVSMSGATSAESTAVSFSPDGTQVATVANDGYVNVWDAARGQALLTLHISSGVPWGLTYSPDGSRLLVTTGRTATEFALHIDELIALARARVTRSLTTEECQRYLHLNDCPSEP